MAKFLFVVEVEESGDYDSNYVSGCNCKPTTLLEYAQSAVESGNRNDILESFVALLDGKVCKSYKKEMNAILKDRGFFSKEDIDKATAIRMKDRFFTRGTSRPGESLSPLKLDELENLSEYYIDQIVNNGGEILCGVEDDSLPKSIKDKIKKARDQAKAKAERKKVSAAKKEEKAKARRIEEAKKLLAEAGL